MTAIRRGLTKRWKPPADGLDQAWHTPLIDRLLEARGVVDAPAIEQFCDPRLNHLHDPQLLPGIDRAAQRIVEAVNAGEQIVLYGDYDVDGMTAVAILYHTIRAAQPEANLRTYVPHRIDDGYGLNENAIEELAAGGARVIVSVDCGISAVRCAALAKRLGVDLIITDHHNPPPELPDAFAIVHPRLAGSAYPFGELCGAGVAFKLAWSLAVLWCGSQRVSRSMQQTLLAMLPLAALGTIADVVPLVDENRVIASVGLRMMKQTQLPGLRALIEAANLMGDDIDDHKVGFVLGPRLNACGRMGHARDAVHMLTDASPQQAGEIARELTRLNQTRQQTERKILEQAIELADQLGQIGDDHRAIVLACEGWHRGVVGIVCSRLTDRFGRPSVLLEKTEDVCHGSARSIDGYSIHSGIESCSDLLLTFGGHDMAAGLSLKQDNLEEFSERFAAHANANISVDELTPAIRIDCNARLHELDVQTVHRIAALAPFGRANPRPQVCVDSALLVDAPRQMGRDGKHLDLRCRQDGPNGQQRWLRCVWWNAGPHAATLAPGQQLDLVIEPKLNTWAGRTTVEGDVRDVRVCAP